MSVLEITQANWGRDGGKDWGKKDGEGKRYNVEDEESRELRGRIRVKGMEEREEGERDEWI